MNIFEKLGIVTKKKFDEEIKKLSDELKVTADIADTTIIENDIKTFKESFESTKKNMGVHIRVLNEKVKVNEEGAVKYKTKADKNFTQIATYLRDMADGNKEECLICKAECPTSLAVDLDWVGIKVHKNDRIVTRVHFVNANDTLCAKCNKLTDIDLYKELIEKPEEDNNEKSN